jgi:amidase
MYQSATELAHLICTGQATSTEIVQAHLAQIKKHNPDLNAVVILLEEEALREAAVCDQEIRRGHSRGPLHGVPLTVKESYWVKGTRSTLNFKMMKDWTAPDDAVIVSRLKKAGAIVLGKTNVPQNLLDYQVWGDIYAEGKNPYNPEFTPGGSSGGSAAALAAGMTPLELGSDFGGSIRVPAHYCGVYGLKTTEKTIPEHGSGPLPEGVTGYISHMVAMGPLARTVDDLALLWRLIRGPHESDRATTPIAWSNPTGKRLSDYKVAWVDGWPGYETSDQTRTVIKNFVDQLKQQGSQLENVAPPNDLHQRSLSLFVRLFPQMIAQGMPRFFKPLMKMQIKNSLLKGLDRFQKEYNQGFKHSFENYIETMAIRAGIVSEWEQFFRPYDLLVCPMSFGPAYERRKIGTPIVYDGQRLIYVNYAWPYVACFNGSGHPAVTVPLGLGKEGLPVGVQVVGPYWSEPDLLHFARLVAGFTPGFVKPDGF